MRRKIQLILLHFIFCGVVLAHGDLDKRIQKVTEEIRLNRDSAGLYFNRARLYFQHEEYLNCLSDLHKAQGLGYDNVLQQLLFAKANYQLKNYVAALWYVEKILSNNSSHVLALKIKARICFDQKEFRKSALAFEEVLDHCIRSFPENYLDASRAWEYLHTQEGQERSIAILESGIQKLGPVPSLYQKLRDLAISYQDFNRALVVQKAIVDHSPRKETAYYQIAKIEILQENFQAA